MHDDGRATRPVRRIALAGAAATLTLTLSVSTVGALAWAGAAQAAGSVPRVDGTATTTDSTTAPTAGDPTAAPTDASTAPADPTVTEPSTATPSSTPAAAPTRRYAVTLAVTSNTARVGRTVRLKVAVKPRGAAAGKRALLQQRTARGKWKQAGTVKIGAKGLGVKKLRSTKPRLLYFRVVMPRDDSALKAASKLTWVVWYRG